MSAMPARVRAALGNQELVLLIALMLLLGTVSIAVPGYLHIETLFTIVRGSMVSLVFAIGVLIVLIAGGIDVSFLTIGIFAAYLTCKTVPTDGGIGAIWLPILLSVAIGVGLGLVNAVLVLTTQVSTLIATLASSAIFLGVLFAFIGGDVISDIPRPLRELGQINLVTVPGAQRGVSRLTLLIVPVVLVSVLVWVFLRRTIVGRWIYAIGGDQEAARRIGVPVRLTRVVVFATAGGLAGLAGIVHITLTGRADPTTFLGGELDVLAAVVLGGALITGGRGSVRGTVLGVGTIAVIDNALIPLGVPSIWQKAVIGLLLLVGVALQALASRVRPLRPILAPDDPLLTGAPPRNAGLVSS